MRALVCLFVVTAALVAGGCGLFGAGTEFEGDEQAVATTISELQAAATATDGPAEICSRLLAPELADRLGAGDTTCAQEMRLAVSDAAVYDLRVTEVQIDGMSASARVESPGRDGLQVATVQLVRREGNWRVSGIDSGGG